MNIKLPTAFMGKPIKGSIERALAAAQAEQGQPDPDAEKVPDPVSNSPAPATSVNDPQNYIILPGSTYGAYSYPETLIAMYRTHTRKNWHDAHKALADEGAYMPTIRQFVDFITLLKSGSVFDGNGDSVRQQIVDDILDGTLAVRSPWRGEWLDAKFETRGGVMGIGSKMHILYEHRFVNGNLEPQQAKEITNYVTSNKTPGIDLEAWLGNANEYGLPPANVASGDLYYWAPVNGRVAGFDAGSDRAGLYCYGGPTFVDDSLGVFACAEGTA